MKFDVIEICKDDNILIKMNVGNLPSEKIDKYVEKVLPKLKKTFGCPISVLPVRDGGWDFTIIRNKNRKVSQSLRH